MTTPLIAHSDNLRSLETFGYRILPHFMPEEQVSAITRDMERIVARGSRMHAVRNLLSESPLLCELLTHAPLSKLESELLGHGAFAVRAIFFDKVEGANWKVPWHQDLSIAVAERLDTEGYGPWSTKDGALHVQPPAEILEQMLTLRIHLDDCMESNGPVRVIPGSHRMGRLNAEQIAVHAVREEVTCEVMRGGIMLMKPLILHASSPALVPGHRRVVHVEFANFDLPGLEWLERVYVAP